MKITWVLRASYGSITGLLREYYVVIRGFISLSLVRYYVTLGVNPVREHISMWSEFDSRFEQPFGGRDLLPESGHGFDSRSEHFCKPTRVRFPASHSTFPAGPEFEPGLGMRPN